jgi:SAM-dependent methyltransferase
VLPYIRRVPGAERAIRGAGLALWRRELSRSAGHRGALPWQLSVRPDLIKRRIGGLDRVLGLTGRTQLRDVLGTTLDGDWDGGGPLEENPIFRAVEDRFVHGQAWECTQYFRNASDSIARGEGFWKVKSRDDLHLRLEKIDALYDEIVETGYRSQRELGTSRPWDEIVVAIDRHGRFLLVDGSHRLALARVIGVEAVPVVVAVRHHRWAEFCTEVQAFADQRGGRLYQPLPHPDLQGIPSAQGYERVDLILERLPATHGRVLDIGANTGLFCHELERRGFDCVAIERSRKEAYILKRLRSAAGYTFEVREQSIVDTELDETFTVTLALNIFHHLCKTREGYEGLIKVLRRLKTDAMFFECHQADDPQMRNAHLNLAPDNFAAFVAEHARLEDVELIGHAEVGDRRPLYLLTGSK